MKYLYLKAVITTDSKDVAERLLGHLLVKKIVAIGSIEQEKILYLVDGQVVGGDEYNVSTYISVKKQPDFANEVEDILEEETSSIVFTPIEGTKNILEVIDGVDLI
jgi:uncharacterized protein involved in tolerance to divalent cations